MLCIHVLQPVDVDEYLKERGGGMKGRGGGDAYLCVTSRDAGRKFEHTISSWRGEGEGGTTEALACVVGWIPPSSSTSSVSKMKSNNEEAKDEGEVREREVPEEE